ncbi:MAG: condensation domain-containing protein [Cyanobacteria bacterium P01_G01_bin.39]
MKTARKNIDQLLLELSQRKIKLWLEGDRLRYKAPKDALTSELLSQVKESKADIISFLKEATNNASTQLPAIVAIDRQDNLPLSFGQQRLWFLHQFEPNSSSYNMPVVVRITGCLNVDVLERSLSELVRRHEVLRTTFPSVNGHPQLVIAPAQPLPLPLIDLRNLPKTEGDAQAFRLATAEAHEPFDLANGPILRVKLFRLQDDEHLLIWNLHCIVCDGGSSDVFYQDLTTIYAAFAADKPSPLPELKIQYVDFAHWQRQWLQGEVLESQLNYWKQQLADLPPALKLPLDRPHPKGVLTYKGDRAALMLPKTLNAELDRLSQKLGATLFMTLLTAFETLLYRYCGQEDILLSFASSGRNQVETERVIGFFSNTLILRTNLTDKLTFKEALARVRQASLEAYAHQDLPFEKLIEELRPNTRQGRSPLFQVKFALNPPWSEGRGMASVKLPDLTFTSLFGYIYHGKTKYDLTLVMREQDEGLGMVFDYNADIFDANTIQKMLEHFRNLLEGVVANPDCILKDLPMLAPGEQLPQSCHDFEAEEIELKIPREKTVETLDKVESKLVEIWQDVLGVDFVGLRDNFFELGGNSLQAVTLFAQIEKQFGKNLPLATLFQSATVVEIAEIIRQEKWLAPWESLVPIQPNGNKPPLFYIHGGGGNLLVYRDLAYSLGSDQPVYGLQPRGLDGKYVPFQRIEDMAAYYLTQIRNLQPSGPYYLAGLSSGGNIAWEIAQILQAQGEKVALLALFDTNGPDYFKLLPPLPRLLSVSRWLVYDFLGRPSRLSLQLKHKLKQLGTKQTSIKILESLGIINKTIVNKTLDEDRKINQEKMQLIFRERLDIYKSIASTISPLEKLVNSIALFLLKHSSSAFYRNIFAFGMCRDRIEDDINNLPDNPADLPKSLQQVQEANSKAYQTYIPQTYSDPVILFRASERPPGFYYDPQLGWGDLPAGGMEIYEIPGNHTSIMKSPVLAEKLKICLDKAQDNQTDNY